MTMETPFLPTDIAAEATNTAPEGHHTGDGGSTPQRRRSRRSAKTAGTRHETTIAAYLAEHVDDRIERRTRNGNKDRGDISGVRTIHGGRVVLECKNTTRLDLAGWAAETELERGNDDAIAGVIVHKRHGVGHPGQQWVTMTVDDLVALLTGTRPSETP